MEDRQADIEDRLRDFVEQQLARQEEPPCAFCVFLLGSLGRKEGTRNSDIEFGILTQSDSEEVIRWFHDFTVAHLKSKILLHVGIPFDEESKDLLGTPEKIMQHYKRQKEKGTTIVQGDNWLDANFLIGDSSLFLRFMRLVSSLRDQQYFLDRLKSEKTKKMMQAAHATADMLVIAGQCGMTLEDSEDAIKEPLYRPFHLFVRDLFFSSFWIDIETTQGGTEDVLAEQSREWEEKTATKREDEEDKQLMKLFFMMSQDEDRQGQSKTRRRIEELWEKQKVATEFKDLLCQMDDVITRVRGQAKPVMVSIEDATLLERGFAAIISFLTRADSSTL